MALTTTLLLASAPTFAQSNRLTINRGATQQAAVTLSPNSNVSIDAVTGNVVVDCAANPANATQCADALGAGNPPPDFAIAASNFPAGTSSPFPALTQFTIAPSGLDGAYETCRRIASGPNTSWDGVSLAGDATVNSVTVPLPNTTYAFSLRCFAATGARTSNILTVVTGQDTGGGGSGNCTNWPGEAWAAFARTPERRFTDLRRPGGSLGVAEFPHIGGLALFGVNLNQYLSVEFTAIPKIDANGDGVINQQDFPALKFLSWIEAQGGLGAADLGGVFFSISRCPGDFRLPPASNIPDPNEPTLNLGCRNLRLQGSVRSITAGIEYSINTTPNNNNCSLAYGQRYYLNFMTVNPLDGYQPNEHNCLDIGGSCGVQLQSQ